MQKNIIALLSAVGIPYLIHKHYTTEKRMNFPKTPVTLIFTDLEPDDIVALWGFAKYQHENKPTERTQFKIVVGEGTNVLQQKSHIASLVMQNLQQKYPDAFLGFDIFHGHGSKKQYPLPYWANAYLDFYRPFVISEHVGSDIKDVILLKPPRELMGKTTEELQALIPPKCVLHMYGSFNIRSVLSQENAEQSIKNILNAFYQVKWYETFSILGNDNAMNTKKDPELIEAIQKNNSNIGLIFKEMMQVWNKFLYNEQVEKLKSLDSVKDAEKIVRTKKIIDSIGQGMKEDGTLSPQMVLADVLIPFALGNDYLEMEPVVLEGFTDEGYPKFKYSSDSNIWIGSKNNESENRLGLKSYLLDLFK